MSGTAGWWYAQIDALGMIAWLGSVHGAWCMVLMYKQDEENTYEHFEFFFRRVVQYVRLVLRSHYQS